MKAFGEQIRQYKALERQEHIRPDDILNKVTQEVIELLQALEKNQQHEIFAEAGDVIANILSLAEELGCDMGEIYPGILSGQKDVLGILGKWNEAVQALRGKYSRKQGNISQVESLTKHFIRTLLNYTDPEMSLADILERNMQKLKSRKNMYKADIDIKAFIASYPNFPKTGINFRDISPILANPDALRYVCHEMAESCRGAEKIVALDARGFIFAPMVAQILGIPWVMARKPGKLPGETQAISYDLEYGSNRIEIQKHAIHPGENIALIDDLLATGGTALAACNLIKELGGNIHSCNFVIALDDEFLKNFPARKELESYKLSRVVAYEE